jgi:hypothetical protein
MTFLEILSSWSFFVAWPLLNNISYLEIFGKKASALAIFQLNSPNTIFKKVKFLFCEIKVLTDQK